MVIRKVALPIFQTFTGIDSTISQGYFVFFTLNPP